MLAEEVVADFMLNEWDKGNETLSFFKIQYKLHKEGIFLEIGEIYDIIYKEVKDESKD